MRNVTHLLCWAAIAVGLWLTEPPAARAQDDAQVPPPAKAAETPPPAMKAPAGADPEAKPPGAAAPDAEPAYLGAVIDDREDRGRGVRIERIIVGGPADKAGLRKGDLITGLGGLRIRQMADFAGILEQLAPGSKLTFEVLRGVSREKIDVVFGSRLGKPVAEAAADLRSPMDLRPPGGLITPAKPQAGKAAAVLGRTPPSAGESQAQVDALRRRIEQLERRVAELERLVSRQLSQ